MMRYPVVHCRKNYLKDAMAGKNTFGMVNNFLCRWLVKSRNFNKSGVIIDDE